jgi:Fuc2NAc and GlcNAc transferase
LSLEAWAVLALTAGLAALGAGLVAASGPIDTVKARSSHYTPTPTGAGLAILAAACLGAALLAPGGLELAVLLGAAAALGLFGAADDVLDLGAGLKLLAQVVACLALAAWAARVDALPLLPGLTLQFAALPALAGSALFLLVLVNAANFMDGSDGLASGWAAVSAAGLTAAAVLADEPDVAAAGAALAAANCGFIPWNLRRRVFQGDVGAFFSAIALGGLGLLLAARDAATPYLVVFAALPLLVDVLLTLIMRARRGARLSEAHKEHLYQRWLQATGRPHLQLAWRVWALTTLTTGIGLAFERYASDWVFAGLMATTALLSAGWVLVRARLPQAPAVRP